MPRPDRKRFSVRNETRGTTVAPRAQLASSLVTRLVGLMFRRSLEPGAGLYFPGTSSIHSFCMRFRFDAIFLDADGRVVKIVPAMRPWRVAFGGRGAKDTLELPAGVAASSGTEPGDQFAYGEPEAGQAPG